MNSPFISPPSTFQGYAMCKAELCICISFLCLKPYKAMFKYYSKWRPQVESNCFFIHEDGRKLTRSYFEHRMQVYVRKAHLTKPCTPHNGQK